MSSAKEIAGFSLKMEVECRSLEEALEACQHGADIVMLDNMTIEQLKVCAAHIKKQYPRVLVEASGGITPETITAYFIPGYALVSDAILFY